MSIVTPGGGGWLLAICLSRVGAYMVYISYANTLPVLQREWQLSGTAAGSISSAFQVAYAISLMAVAAAVLLYRTPEAVALHQRHGAHPAAASVPVR